MDFSSIAPYIAAAIVLLFLVYVAGQSEWMRIRNPDLANALSSLPRLWGKFRSDMSPDASKLAEPDRQAESAESSLPEAFEIAIGLDKCLVGGDHAVATALWSWALGREPGDRVVRVRSELLEDEAHKRKSLTGWTHDRERVLNLERALNFLAGEQLKYSTQFNQVSPLEPSEPAPDDLVAATSMLRDLALRMCPDGMVEFYVGPPDLSASISFNIPEADARAVSLGYFEDDLMADERVQGLPSDRPVALGEWFFASPVWQYIAPAVALWATRTSSDEGAEAVDISGWVFSSKPVTDFPAP